MSSDWSFHNKTLIVSRCQPSLLSIVKINKKKIYDHKKNYADRKKLNVLLQKLLRFRYEIPRSGMKEAWTVYV